MVKTRACPLLGKADEHAQMMKDHQHTRTQVVPGIPNYDALRKHRMIRHMITDEERRDWLIKRQNNKNASKI